MFQSLRSKILLGFAVIVLVNVAFGLWAIYRFATVGASTAELITSQHEQIAAAANMASLADAQLERLQQMITSAGRSEAITAFEAGETEFRQQLRLLSSQQLVSGRESTVAGIRDAYEEFRRSASHYRWVVAGLEEGSPRSIFADSVRPAALALKQACFSLMLRRPVEISEMRDAIDYQVQRSLIFVGIGTLAALLIGIVGGSYYSRWVVRPIGRLTQAARNLAGGQLGERILITSNDELGDLSFEFNRMIERLRTYEEMNIEQLLLEKRKVETIVQSIGTPIIVVDASMRVMLMNTAALEMLRLPIRTEYIDRPLISLVVDESLLPPLRRALEREGSETRGSVPELYIRFEEGRERFFSVAALPLATTSAVRGAVAVFTDITHFKELDRLKSDFLAKVSHEFRTPLSSIIMGLDILREGLLGPVNEAQLDMLTTSKDDCRRLSKLITDLLELSRVDARRGSRTLVQIDLRQLVEETLKPHDLPSRDKGVRVVAEVDEGVPEIWADPEELRWVVNNLVSNALRHTGAGGRVTVRVAQRDASLTMSVSDTGEGIPLDSLGRIFDRFHQVGASSGSTPGSVGLGLSIVKEVVEGYGGTVDVASELGHGSTFTVVIPMERLAPQGPTPYETEER